MVQVTLSVGTARNGSINAVEGSGIASMSEASIDFHPRIDEPSKPKPSSKTSSVSSPIGQEKCCQVPKVSTNFTSTILAPSFLAKSMAVLPVMGLLDLPLLMRGSEVARLLGCQFTNESSPEALGIRKRKLVKR